MTSSPPSFVTANESPLSSPSFTPNIRTPTPRSTPQRRVTRPIPQHFYRTTKTLPFDLQEHAHVYLSEELYLEAITLLTRLLEAGYGASTPESSIPAFLPPSQHLALIATLIVHPKYSTHAKSVDAGKVSHEALRYIRALCKIVGTVNGDLLSVFKFSDGISLRRRIRNSDSDEVDGITDFARLKQAIANSKSLWTLARDFWHLVGWSFNCSVRHRNRWARWKLFLELLLDLMEDDWNARKLAVEAKALEPQERQDAMHDVLQQSLVWMYMSAENPGSSTGRRKILRAIFAAGSSESMQQFGEIFPGESKEPQKPDEGEKRRARDINIDENDFGDYDTDSDNDDEREVNVDVKRSGRARQKTRKSLANETEYEDLDLTGMDILGGSDALKLRLRLLNLLSELSLDVPQSFTDQADLFDNCTEFLRPLQCSLYLPILSYPGLSEFTQNNLNSLLLFDIVSRQRPPVTVIATSPSIQDLETYYFPIAAKTQNYPNQAKISIILEVLLGNLFRRMRTNDELRADVLLSVQSGRLRKAVEAGIDRRKKAFGDSKMKGKVGESEERNAKIHLEESSKRLMMHLIMLEGSKAFGRRTMALPYTPSRPRYVLIETPTPLKRETFAEKLARKDIRLSQQSMSSLSDLSDTPPVSSTPVQSDGDSDI